MRTTLLGSLLDIAAGNVARGAGNLALFESTRVYLRNSPTRLKGADTEQNRPVDPLAGKFAGDQPAPFSEPHRFAGIAVGSLTPRSWRGGGEAADFFAVKGVLEALAGPARGRARVRACRAALPPSRSLGRDLDRWR